MSKERPILFSSDMVRAVLAGRKTQTRRIVKFKSWPETPVVAMVEHFEPFSNSPKNEQFWSADHKTNEKVLVEQNLRCPYGEVGDRLYVRERTRLVTIDGNYLKTGVGHCHFRYEVDGAKADIWTPERIKPIKLNHCVPNGCFKELARIWRENVSIKVEQMKGTYYLYADEILESGIITTRKIIDPWAWVIEFTKAEGRRSE